MTVFQILTPLEWFAFVGVPTILVVMGWAAVKANEIWLDREIKRDRERERLG